MRKFSSGFTLVELMVAVVISVVGLVFVFSALQSSANVLSISEKMKTANELLNRKIWESDKLEAASGAVMGETSGVFAAPYEAFSWMRNVSEFSDVFQEDTDEDVDAHLWRETTTIFWSGRSGTEGGRNLTLVRFLKRLS